MPRGDRTGPVGAGPMTGKAAGYCAGYNTPGYMNPMPGRGWGGRGGFRGAGRGGIPWGGGRGRAWGGGRGPGWYAGGYPPYHELPTVEVPRETEIQDLKAQAEYFKSALTEIKNRLDELSRQESENK
ncbi:MAG: DUF5320 domain-containing protein [candidate division Zixibacteria bacterium]|nr:DUF5320 domain-containing protein [Candidatus Tariuqbacter arcticus]